MLQVTGPKARAFDFSRKTRSVDVTIELPSGSQVSARDAGGRLPLRRPARGVQVQDLRRERPARADRPAALDTSAGHVTADGIAGNAEISTGTGKVQIGDVEGTAVVKNSNGDTTIDAVTGDVRVRAANGGISVERAGAGVDAKTSNGSIRLGEVARGSVVLGTAMGDLDIGIAEGTAAWLRGEHRVRAGTQPAGERHPARGVRRDRRGARRTSFGDITIRRS